MLFFENLALYLQKITINMAVNFTLEVQKNVADCFGKMKIA